MGHKVSVIYMDLFKAFGSLNYELLIARLKCYGLDQHAVEFFRTYLSNYCQSLVKIALEIGGNYGRCTTGYFVIQYIFK